MVHLIYGRRFFVCIAIALRCWDCEGSSCGDPFDKNKIPQSKSIECAGTLGMGDPTCVKIKSTCKLLVKWRNKNGGGGGGWYQWTEN